MVSQETDTYTSVRHSQQIHRLSREELTSSSSYGREHLDVHISKSNLKPHLMPYSNVTFSRITALNIRSKPARISKETLEMLVILREAQISDVRKIIQ